LTGGTGENYKMSVRIAGFRAEVWIQDFPNWSETDSHWSPTAWIECRPSYNSIFTTCFTTKLMIVILHISCESVLCVYGQYQHSEGASKRWSVCNFES
jgi:hypothetical protein